MTQITRIEASFSGRAFAPHRHDDYVVGVTLSGIQTFDYRGAKRASYPGQIFVLFPDEVHDGRAGDDMPFSYRSIYIQPATIRALLHDAPLPFVKDGISTNPALIRAVQTLLADMNHPLSTLEREDKLFDLVISLCRAAGETKQAKVRDVDAATRAKAYIDASIAESFSLDDLELATGRERFALSRDFRAAFGASPYRYLTMRRLERARAMIRDGETIAAAASAAGFSDQSHMTRQFKKAYGLTPNRWRKIIQYG